MLLVGDDEVGSRTREAGLGVVRETQSDPLVFQSTSWAHSNMVAWYELSPAGAIFRALRVCLSKVGFEEESTSRFEEDPPGITLEVKGHQVDHYNFLTEGD